MSFIRFSLDQHRLPLYQVQDPRYGVLGTWMLADISVNLPVCLDALEMIDDVSAGRPLAEEWSSEHYDVTFEPDGVTLRNLWVEGEEGRYSVEEVREALEEYWRFLASRPENPHLVRDYWPDLPLWEAELRRWEQRWERQHPYRGRLF